LDPPVTASITWSRLKLPGFWCGGCSLPGVEHDDRLTTGFQKLHTGQSGLTAVLAREDILAIAEHKPMSNRADETADFSTHNLSALLEPLIVGQIHRPCSS
jgi:hypothetical protein